MTVHSVEIVFDGSPAQTDAESTVDNWVSSYTTVLDAQATPTDEQDNVAMLNTEIDGSGKDYYKALYRFDLDHTLSSIMDDIETGIQGLSGVDWYRIRYHECGHDGTGGACSWDEELERSSGTIPEGV